MPARASSRLVVDVSAEGVRVPVSRALVRDAAERTLRAEKVRDALVSITFVTDKRIAQLNREHLGHRGPTDVISFGFAATAKGSGLVGDIYIAPAVGRANAISGGVPIREELLRLVVHGTLHVVGHVHPEGEDAERRYGSRMWKRQEALLRRILAT